METEQIADPEPYDFDKNVTVIVGGCTISGWWSKSRLPVRMFADENGVLETVELDVTQHSLGGQVLSYLADKCREGHHAQFVLANRNEGSRQHKPIWVDVLPPRMFGFGPELAPRTWRLRVVREPAVAMWDESTLDAC
jgi:hypothetical protein